MHKSSNNENFDGYIQARNYACDKECPNNDLSLEVYWTFCPGLDPAGKSHKVSVWLSSRSGGRKPDWDRDQL